MNAPCVDQGSRGGRHPGRPCRARPSSFWRTCGRLSAIPRDRDLPALLWRWQRAAPEERPRRLEDLRACIDGRPYPDPYQESRGYTEADVDRCADLLEDFLAGLRAEPAGAAERSRRLLEALEALDRDRGGALLDNWRRQRLARLLQNAAALAGR